MAEERQFTPQEREIAAQAAGEAVGAKPADADDAKFVDKVRANLDNPGEAMEQTPKPSMGGEKLHNNTNAVLQEIKSDPADLASERKEVTDMQDLVKEFDDKTFKGMLAEATRPGGDMTKVIKLRRIVADGLMKQPDFNDRFPGMTRADPLMDPRVKVEVDAILNNPKYANEVRAMLEQSADPSQRPEQANLKELHEKHIEAKAEEARLLKEKTDLETQIGQLETDIKKLVGKGTSRYSAEALHEAAKLRYEEARINLQSIRDTMRTSRSQRNETYDPRTGAPINTFVDPLMSGADVQNMLRPAEQTLNAAMTEMKKYASLAQLEQKRQELQSKLPKAETDYEAAKLKAAAADKEYTISKLDRVDKESAWKEKQMNMFGEALNKYQLQRRTEAITEMRKRILSKDKETDDAVLRMARRKLVDRYDRPVFAPRLHRKGLIGWRIERYAYGREGNRRDGQLLSQKDLNYLLRQGEEKYLEYFLEQSGANAETIKRIMEDPRLADQRAALKNDALNRLIDAGNNQRNRGRAAPILGRRELRVLQGEPWFKQRVVEAAKNSPFTKNMAEAEVRGYLEGKTRGGRTNVDLIRLILNMISGISTSALPAT